MATSRTPSPAAPFGADGCVQPPPSNKQIPKAIFYLVKGDYKVQGSGIRAEKLAPTPDMPFRWVPRETHGEYRRDLFKRGGLGLQNNGNDLHACQCNFEVYLRCSELYPNKKYGAMILVTIPVSPCRSPTSISLSIVYSVCLSHRCSLNSKS